MVDVLITFEDGTTELRPAASPAHERRVGWGPPIDADGWGADVVPPALAKTPRGDVWVQRDGQWVPARSESMEEQVERLTRERDAARRIAVLDRIPLTQQQHKELLGLVAQAKKERWLR